HHSIAVGAGAQTRSSNGAGIEASWEQGLINVVVIEEQLGVGHLFSSAGDDVGLDNLRGPRDMRTLGILRDYSGLALMDIGVWMAATTLEHKLEAREEKNTEQAWNLSLWPRGLSQEGQHRLFVASGGRWRGYFTLSGEALYSPEAVSAAFTLL